MTRIEPTRPALALRVGITGTRDLDAAQIPRLTAQLRDLLVTLRRELDTLAGEDDCLATFYTHQAGQAPTPHLRFLSPLARGADRLAARVALDEGYELHVPMPFPQVMYEQDFGTPEDLTEFQMLLQQAGANRLDLDGDRASARDSSYEAAGRYVVRNCDLLVAIWDGQTEGTGRGGTADIVRYAASTAVPTWWLHAVQDSPPVWLADAQDLRDPELDAAPPDIRVRDYLRGLVLPPSPCPRHHHGITNTLAHAGHAPHIAPMAEYFSQREPAALFVWNAHRWFMRAMSGRAGPAAEPDREPDPRTPHDPVAAFWFARYRPANKFAIRYADRYRSSYVWTFLFATLSVALGAGAQVFSLLQPGSAALDAWTVRFVAAELAVLLLILLLVGWGMRHDWHEHSIEFRLLAELCRKQQALGPLGWTLPIVDLRGLAETEDAVPERGAWVAWLFAAEQRAAPLPTGALADAAQGQPRRMILDELIAAQRAYHADRAIRDGRAGHRLALIGEAFFMAGLFLVMAKLAFKIEAHLPEAGGDSVCWPPYCQRFPPSSSASAPIPKWHC